MEADVPDRQGQQVSNSFRLIFPALYNGPVNYFARIIREDRILLEQYDYDIERATQQVDAQEVRQALDEVVDILVDFGLDVE